MDKSFLEEIYFHSKITLLEISLIRTITTLCNDRELCSLILQCDFRMNERYRFCLRKEKAWKAVEGKANELISQLFIPISLQKKMLDLLWPVCTRIMMWKSVYAPSIEQHFVQHFYWTDRGRVHNVRTARHILGNTNIPVTKRFALASSVCSSKEIGEIWREMSDADKACVENITRVSPLAFYWAKAIRESGEDFTHPIGLLQGGLNFAFESGLVNAVKFIFVQLTEGAKKSLLNYYFNRLFYKSVNIKIFDEYQNEMIYFFFFEMTDDKQRFIFKEGTLLVFALFLQALKYELCLSLIEERIQNLCNDDIVVVLQFIFYAYHVELADGDACTKLFYDVWRITPSVTRNYLASTDFGALYPLLLIRDHFSFVLEKETVQEIDELISKSLKFSSSNKQFEFDRGKWKFLHFFIEEEITTISVLESYKADVLILLKIAPFDNAVWSRLLRFVSYVASKNSQRKELNN